ncbi:hypothetical protein CXF85_21060 [Colwellia sp. 75C3]|uniref:hypothetical protein n=1 Tax=Colwellia sp. 75C3 TaxID=888425 RepID=UPI000C34A9F1|nr:hypothetical protein [Colwellia sp. 75C3]PKG80619.1 hypothetical protein CXF85_21060 [Colwellia sp. 75C3]
MSLCLVVSKLATELETQLDGCTSSQQSMLKVMVDMPKYLAKNDLALWEADYRSSISEDEDEKSLEYKAIDILYELAGLNLFGKFQVSVSKQVYSSVVANLERLGIQVTSDLDVSRW